MSNYTDKEKKIINQCNNGPFHTLVTDLTNEEFDNLVAKLISDNSLIFPSLVAIYRSYNVNKIIDYYIEKGDVELLLGFLDYCHDFSDQDNNLDQNYIVNKLIEKNDKQFIKDIIKSDSIYFFYDQKEKDRLIKYIS